MFTTHGWIGGKHLSIHYVLLIQSQVAVAEGFPDIPLPRNNFQLFQQDSKAFLAQMRYTIPPTCSGSLTSWTCLQRPPIESAQEAFLKQADTSGFIQPEGAALPRGCWNFLPYRFLVTTQKPNMIDESWNIDQWSWFMSLCFICEFFVFLFSLFSPVHSYILTWPRPHSAMSLVLTHSPSLSPAAATQSIKVPLHIFPFPSVSLYQVLCCVHLFCVPSLRLLPCYPEPCLSPFVNK